MTLRIAAFRTPAGFRFVVHGTRRLAELKMRGWKPSKTPFGISYQPDPDFKIVHI